MTKTVALQKCEDYDFDRVYGALKNLARLSPLPDVKGKTVLLKPNILMPKKPETAVCTHPVIVGAAVKLFVEHGARVIVGESPAVSNSTNAAKVSGIYDAVMENGGEWVEFNESCVVEFPEGRIVKRFEFAKPFLQADMIVSLSKLKTHQFMLYTGAMKNLFGLMVGLKKAQTHYRFPDKKDFGSFLTDLNIAAKPSYAIMDAVVCMEGRGGPGNGNPVQVGFLGASDNVLALDWVCSSAVGYDPYQVTYLKSALERKFWLESPEQIEIAGNAIDEVKPERFEIVREDLMAVNFQKAMPEWINSLVRKLLIKTPRFNPKKCIKCGRCTEICPAQILNFKGEDKAKRVEMSDRKKCLHCFCCHEVCPVEAITLERF